MTKRNYYAVQYAEKCLYPHTAKFISVWGQAKVARFGSRKERDEWVNEREEYRRSCTYAFAKLATDNFNEDVLVDADNPTAEDALDLGL